MLGRVLRRERETAHRGGGTVKTEAGAGVMCPQAQDQQEPAEAGRSREEEFNPDTLIWDFWPS